MKASKQAETFPLLGLVRDSRRKGWAVVRIDLTAEDLLERGHVLFDPEPREDAINNLRAAVVQKIMYPTLTVTESGK